MIFLSFISSIFGALTIVLVYKISKYFLKSEKFRIISTITFGLGTLVFPYATSFQQHSIGMFFSFFSFYMLFKIKEEKNNSNIYKILSGLLIGFAITTSYLSILVFCASLFYFLFAIRKNYKDILVYLFGFFVGILPLLVYNFIIFGNIFHVNLLSIDFSYGAEIEIPELFLQDKISWFIDDSLDFDDVIYHFSLLANMLFSPYRGLFFYSPILLLFLPGIFLMYKKYKMEVLTIIFLIMISFWFLSTHY